jgi:hypothetical protein
MLKMKAKDSSRIKSNIKNAQDYLQGKFNKIDDASANLLAKWYVWRHLNEIGSDADTAAIDDFMPWIMAAFPNHKDYLSAQIDQKGSIGKIKSSLNNPKYSISKINDDIDLWHEKLEAEAGSMPEKGNSFINLGEKIGSEWEGWEWAELGKGQCSKEAKAMGHCGNTGARIGDNIISLRDPKGRAHLTFILNNGMLGEMKGRSNTKPKKAYHPAIVELLRHDEIESVVGGGYKPENNFSLDDLDDEIKEKLLEEKPDIENGMDKQIEAIDERLKEIEDEWNGKWSFAYAHASVEDYGEDIYISSSGGWYLDISDWDVAQHWDFPERLPAYNDKEKYPSLKTKLKEALDRIDLIGEDFEFDKESMRSDFPNRDAHDLKDPEEFDAHCDYLNDEIEPKKERAIQIIKSVLMEEGYMKPSYSSQILGYGMRHAKKDYDPSSNWDDLNFKHFSWDEGDEADDDEIGPHTVHVTLDDPIELLDTQYGASAAVKEFLSTTRGFQSMKDNFIQSIKKEIHNMAQKQASSWNRQKTLPGFQKPNISTFSIDSMIHPEINIYAYGSKIRMYINFYFNITHGKEEILESKKFIKFLDDNFERFSKLASGMFFQQLEQNYTEKKKLVTGRMNR